MNLDRTPAISRRWLWLLPWLALLPLGLAGRGLQAAPQDTFVVNTLIDVQDAVLGDGVCETILATCSLRAAIQEANAFGNPETIILPAAKFSLTLAGADNTALRGDLDITAPLSLVGAGAASTIIDAGAINERVVHVLSGTVTIAGVTLQNGRDVVGGGLFVGLSGTVTLSETTVFSNTALGSVPNANPPAGGGVYNVGELTVLRSALLSNTVGATAPQPAGAGLHNLGTLTVRDTLFSGNVSAGRAGGLYAGSSAALITGSTFSQNAAQNGGGLYTDSPDLHLVNSTFSGNQAERAGGGIHVGFGAVTLQNVTVTGNSANGEEDGNYDGGGLMRGGVGTVTLQNSLLAGNLRIDWTGPFVEASDCAGSLQATAPNLVGSTDLPCIITGLAPLTGSAQLHPLANNGGPTPTHALRPNSPAIDAGSAAGCTNEGGAPLLRDQRGTPRPLLGRDSLRCDLGAFEYVPPVFVPLLQR